MEILQFEFMQHALAAGLMVSAVCGIVGVYVVVNRLVFISGGIAHTSFGGVGVGLFLGINPVFGALVFALSSAATIGLLHRKMTVTSDSAIGMLWAAGMAIGVVFMGLTPGYIPDVSTYLFGNILIVSVTDLWLMLILLAIILSSVLLLYKPFFSFSFDREFAEVKGLPVQALYLYLLGLIALSVVVMMKTVGIILVIALLTIPTIIARQFTHDMIKMMAGSVALCVLFTLTGLAISWYLDIASGAAIVLTATLAFAISLAAKD